LGTGSFVHHRIVSEVKRVEFVSDRMSYMVLRGCWYNIKVLNVSVSSEEKSYDSKDGFDEKLEQISYHFSKNHVKIPLGDLNAKVGRKNIFKPTLWNESLHQVKNNNGVKIVNFSTSKTLVVKSTMFPHGNIFKYT
jgi:hypothetical protein